VPLYTVVALDDASAVEREFYSQLDMFRYLVGRDPSHVNSHQHVHMRDPLRSIALEFCQNLGVPLRNLCSEVNYFMQFYGQTAEGLPRPTAMAVDQIIAMLLALPSGYELRSEEIFRAQKSGVEFEVMISLFCKTA
jgi:chitin disaccharide deacetylase